MPIPHRAPVRAELVLPVLLFACVILLAGAGPARAAECNVTVEPATVAVGDEFVVSGDFGANAEIHLVRGRHVGFPEGSEPIATIPVGQSSFNVTFTAEAGDEGVWTVWAFIFGTECGDSAPLTITSGRVPNTGASPPPSAPLALIGSLFLALAVLGFMRSRHWIAKVGATDQGT
jgi:hypothetical protein